MEPMKPKINHMFSAVSKGYVDGREAPNLADLEIRPCGMLVQKRNGDANPTSVSVPMIRVRVRVKFGSLYNEISISSYASFGELKKMLAGPTKLHHEDQKLIYKNKERHSKEFLDVARVRDGSKIVLEEDIASREKRCVEFLRNANSKKTLQALAEITLEVDNLAAQVTALEATASKGRKFGEKDVENLTELLMMRLIKLDGIVAEGDLKLQRRLLVRKVQKYIEILDKLKLQNSKSSSNVAKIQLQKTGDVAKDSRPMPKQQAPIKLRNSVRTTPKMQQQQQIHSETMFVTTKWETFE